MLSVLHYTRGVIIIVAIIWLFMSGHLDWSRVQTFYIESKELVSYFIFSQKNHWIFLSDYTRNYYINTKIYCCLPFFLQIKNMKYTDVPINVLTRKQCLFLYIQIQILYQECKYLTQRTLFPIGVFRTQIYRTECVCECTTPCAIRSTFLVLLS